MTRLSKNPFAAFCQKAFDWTRAAFPTLSFGDEHEPVSGHFEGQLTAPNMPDSKISYEGEFFLCRAPNEYAL